MTVKELRTLVDNLDEYIRIPGGIERLRKTILHLAISGKLVPQDPNEGTGQKLYDQIQVEKAQLIKEGLLKKQKELPSIEVSEVPFEIPKSWMWVRLAEITNFTIGRTPKRIESKYWDDEYMSWVSIADLNDNGYVDDTKEKVSKVAFDEVFHSKCVPAGSLLYSFKLTIGKMSILSIDAVHNEAIASFAVYSKITRDYLFKALKALDPTTRTNAAIKGMTLNSGTLSLLEVPLPPLHEQQRIVKKLDRVFVLIDKLEDKYINEEKSRNQLTVSSMKKLTEGNTFALDYFADVIKNENDVKQLENAILSLAVSGLLVPQVHVEGTGDELRGKILYEKSKTTRGKNRSANTQRIDENEKPYKLPKTWDWIRLGDLTNMTNGYAFKSSEWKTAGLPIIRIQNLNNHNAPYNYVNEADVEDKYLVNDSQVLLSWSGTPGTSFGVFIWDRGKAALNQHIFKCELFGVDSNYFKVAANIAIYSKLDSAHGGVGLKHLTKPQLDILLIPLPPLKEQIRIVDKINEVLDITKRLRSTLSNN